MTKTVVQWMAVLCGISLLGACALSNEKLQWLGLGRSGIVIDSHDQDGIERYGDWPLGIGGGDWNDRCLFAFQGKGECRFRWRPDLPADGRYRVSVWFPGDPNRDHATDSPFTVCYDGGSKTHRIDQTHDSGGWLDLGVYPFKAGTAGYVELTNNANGNVVADAVRFKRAD